MKKIYVVTSGTYSDYHIDGIFDTKELAEKFMTMFNDGYEEMDIEEWDLNPFEKSIQEGKRAYFIRMDKDGNTKQIEACNSTYGFRDDGEETISFTWNNELMNNHCIARDEKHAIKITNERRTQILANNMWGKYK